MEFNFIVYLSINIIVIAFLFYVYNLNLKNHPDKFNPLTHFLVPMEVGVSIIAIAFAFQRNFNLDQLSLIFIINLLLTPSVIFVYFRIVSSSKATSVEVEKID